MSESKFSNEIKTQFQLLIGETKFKALSETDKNILEAISVDAAFLQEQAMHGRDISKEMLHINAQLQLMASAKLYNVKKLFWHAVSRAVQIITSTVITSAIAAI